MSYTLTHLTTELASRPLGLDEARPRFGWRIDSEDRDVLQRAYRVTVSREGEILWDSGLVESAETQWIEYAGKALLPRTEYQWKVVSYAGESSAEAESSFETGLMDSSIAAWRGAKWIGDRETGLAARAKSIFAIDLNFRMKGQAAGVIFGKNDPRLLDKNKNDHGLAGENYIKYRVTREGRLEIYRVGYAPDDRADAPLGQVALANFDPDALLCF